MIIPAESSRQKLGFSFSFLTPSNSFDSTFKKNTVQILITNKEDQDSQPDLISAVLPSCQVKEIFPNSLSVLQCYRPAVLYRHLRLACCLPGVYQIFTEWVMLLFWLFSERSLWIKHLSVAMLVQVLKTEKSISYFFICTANEACDLCYLTLYGLLGNIKIRIRRQQDVKQSNWKGKTHRFRVECHFH